VLILREILGYSAAETADMLDTSVASVNSALQRARSTMVWKRVRETEVEFAKLTDA
jgi:RNA polymerase sigma-70 factor (ECF subfamily)